MRDDINIEKLDPSIFEKEEMPFMMLPTKVVQLISSENPMAAIIWVYLQSLPPTWNPNKFHLMSHFKIGERTYQKYMAYLADVNLVSYTRGRNKNGTLGQVKLIVHNGSNFKPALTRDHTAKICVVDFNHTAKKCGVDHTAKTPRSGENADYINNINKYYKENKKPPISPKGGSKVSSFSLSQMLEDNPFQIPEAVLSDWIEVRKAKRAKLTPTAWKQANDNLVKLKEAGLNPLECFVKAVANGWSGVEFRFFERDIEALKAKPRYPTHEERAENEKRIREREIEAQKRKQEEIKAANKAKSRIYTHINAAEMMKRQEAHRRELGLSASEYHEQIVLGKNKTGMPEDNF